MTKSIERNIARMTWMEVRDLDKTSAALVLPLGSLEQHGPHLTVDTDLYFSERLLELALERLAETQYLSLEFTGSTVAWLTRDFQPTGAWGDATVATAARGQIRVEKVVEQLCEILVEIPTFEFPNSQ